MARGKPLTNVEKYAIQGLISKGMSIGQIAVKIARSDTLVRKYVDEELSQLKELVDEDLGYLPKDVAKAVYDGLLEHGMDKVDAVSCIDYIRSKLTETATMDHVGFIIDKCLKKTNIRSMFVRKAEGGREGIAVMNKGTSEVLDELRKNRKSKNMDDCIFKQEHAIPKGLE